MMKQTHYSKRPSMAIETCDLGNGVVRSSRNNVPTAGVPPGWGPAKTPMENCGEPLLNLVTAKWRKALKRHAKRQVARGRCSSLTTLPPDAQPGERRFLKESLKVDLAELGKPNGFLGRRGIPTAREGNGPVGKACRRKRMPSCSGRDRGLGLPELGRDEWERPHSETRQTSDRWWRAGTHSKVPNSRERLDRNWESSRYFGINPRAMQAGPGSVGWRESPPFTRRRSGDARFEWVKRQRGGTHCAS